MKIGYTLSTFRVPRFFHPRAHGNFKTVAALEGVVAESVVVEHYLPLNFSYIEFSVLRV